MTFTLIKGARLVAAAIPAAKEQTRDRPSALGYAVARLVALTAGHFCGPQRPMFGFSPPHTLTPKAVRARLQVLSHQGTDGVFTQRKLGEDGLEGRAVLPGHLDDTGHRCGIEQKIRPGPHQPLLLRSRL